MTREEQIKRHIKSDLALTGTKTEIVYRAMGLCKASWANRMKDPDSFTAREIRILRKFVSKDTADMITE